ncbi:hypothetical protein Tco_0249832 [Tanacetum coccineum]
MLLAQALEVGVVLDEEHTVFLAYDGEIIAIGHDTQELNTTAIFQTDDLDAFDTDCDEAPSANQSLKETENEVVDDTTSSAQQDSMIMSLIE